MTNTSLQKKRKEIKLIFFVAIIIAYHNSVEVDRDKPC